MLKEDGSVEGGCSANACALDKDGSTIVAAFDDGIVKA